MARHENAALSIDGLRRSDRPLGKTGCRAGTAASRERPALELEPPGQRTLPRGFSGTGGSSGARSGAPSYPTTSPNREPVIQSERACAMSSVDRPMKFHHKTIPPPNTNPPGLQPSHPPLSRHLAASQNFGDARFSGPQQTSPPPSLHGMRNTPESGIETRSAYYVHAGALRAYDERSVRQGLHGPP
jgi:hypothetical protein